MSEDWGLVTLPTSGDPEKVAIGRLKAASDMALKYYGTPLVVTTSGGKDSSVCVELALRGGIPFEVQHNHTTADAPETVRFVRQEFARLENLGVKCTINYPTYKGKRTSMWDLIPQKTDAAYTVDAILLFCAERTGRKRAVHNDGRAVGGKQPKKARQRCF